MNVRAKNVAREPLINLWNTILRLKSSGFSLYPKGPFQYTPQGGTKKSSLEGEYFLGNASAFPQGAPQEHFLGNASAFPQGAIGPAIRCDSYLDPENFSRQSRRPRHIRGSLGEISLVLENLR